MATITKDQVERDRANLRNGLYGELFAMKEAHSRMYHAWQLLYPYDLGNNGGRWQQGDAAYVDNFSNIKGAMNRVRKRINEIESTLIIMMEYEAKAEEPVPAITPSKGEVEKP
jgi:hypothetical protein